MNRDRPRFLSVIIPVYNQEETIARNLRSILGELKLLEVSYEVIVVIDGSNDRSFDEAKSVR